MKPVLYFTVGISSSGKTKFANYIKELIDAVNINADDIRLRLTGDISNQSRNKEVFETMNKEIEQQISAGNNVIVSNTNLQIGKLKEYREHFKENKIVLFLMLDSLIVETCKKRLRKDLENNTVRSRVPEEVLDKQHSSFINIIEQMNELKKDFQVFTVNSNFYIEKV